MLAVSLGFVVLFAILDEPAPALRRPFALTLELILERLFMRRIVKLLLNTRMGLVAVLPFGMPLRALLISLAHRTLLPDPGSPIGGNGRAGSRH